MRLSYPTALLAFIIFATTLVPSVKADSNGPALRPGDSWTYDYSTLTTPSYLSKTATQTVMSAARLAPTPIAIAPVFLLNLTGTLTQTMRSIQTLNSVLVAEIASSGHGNLFVGLSIIGNWTIGGTAFFRFSDLAEVGGTTTIQLKFNSTTYTVTTGNMVNPARETLSFPLYSGKTWTQTVATQTNSTTSFVTPPNPPSTNTTTTKNNATTTYSVINDPAISVPAGSFNTYEILSSDGSTIGLSYYSPMNSLVVRKVISLTTGPVITSMSLRSYAVPYQATFNTGIGLSVYVQSEVPVGNFQDNGTAFRFIVYVTLGTPARVTVTFPKLLNTTHISTYIDNLQTFPAIVDPHDNYSIPLSIPQSTHTVTVVYAKPHTEQTSLLPTTGYVAATVLAVAVIGVIAITLLVRKRKRS